MKPLSIPPLHDVDIKHLRLFKAVVECGGLSAAEEVTGLGTSAISKQLADLETRVGSQLCIRGRDGFSVTSIGSVAYEATLRLLDAIDEFRETVGTAKADVKGELSLWLIDHCTLTPGNPISVAIAEFCRRYPNVDLSVNVAVPDLVERAVAEKKAAIGITISKSNLASLVYRVVGSEVASLYCGRGHPAFGLEAPAASALLGDGSAYVRRGYLTHEQLPVSFPQAPRAVAHHVEGTVQLLLSGQFIGIVPDQIAQPWVDKNALYRIPIADFIFERPVFVVTRGSPAVTRLADLMRDVVFEAYIKAQ
ncbi:MAG: LysR family transcriptional regulator [Janthinobacterium lividum]